MASVWWTEPAQTGFSPLVGTRTWQATRLLQTASPSAVRRTIGLLVSKLGTGATAETLLQRAQPPRLSVRMTVPATAARPVEGPGG